MGMRVRVTGARRRRRIGVRVAALGRRDVQHLPRRQRDHPPRRGHARARRRLAAGPRGARELRALRKRPAACSTSARPGASTRRASSRAGRSTAPARCSAAAGARASACDAGGDVLLRGGAGRRGASASGIRCAARVAGRDAGARPRRGHLGHLRARPAHRRPAHRPAAGRRAVGDRRRRPTWPADAYATAAFAMGLDGPAWTAALRRLDAMTILADGRVLSTPGMADLRLL